MRRDWHALPRRHRTLLDLWQEYYAAPLTRMREVVTDLKSGPALDLAMLSVALRELRTLG